MGSRFARGAVYIAGASWAAQMLNVVTVLLVARWLGPEDFGVYALAVAAHEVIGVVGAFAVAPALVQAREESPSLFDTGFAMSLALGLLGLVISGGVAWFLWTTRGQEPALFVLALAGTRVLILLNDVRFARMDRQIRYGPMAAIELSSRGVPNLLCLGLAWSGLGAWSLIARDVFSAGMSFVLVRQLSRYRFGRQVSRESFRRIWSFAGPVFVARTLDIVFNRLDRVMVGAYLGNTAIGLYHQARYLAEAGMLVALPVMRVTLNLYSRLQDDTPRLARVYSLVNFCMTRALFGGAVALAVAPEETIRLLLGSEWVAAAPVLQLLAPYAALLPFLDNMKVMLLARAQVRHNVWLRVAQLVVFVPGVMAATWLGSPEGVAASLTASSVAGVVLASVFQYDIVRGRLAYIYLAPGLACVAGALATTALRGSPAAAALPWWTWPFLAALSSYVAVALLDRGRLLREARYLVTQLRGGAAQAG